MEELPAAVQRAVMERKPPGLDADPNDLRLYLSGAKDWNLGAAAVNREEAEWVARVAQEHWDPIVRKTAVTTIGRMLEGAGSDEGDGADDGNQSSRNGFDEEIIETFMAAQATRLFDDHPSVRCSAACSMIGRRLMRNPDFTDMLLAYFANEPASMWLNTATFALAKEDLEFYRAHVDPILSQETRDFTDAHLTPVELKR